MKVTGIVAEYNPFHNGHKTMVEKCRANGADRVVAVMSGNFVQRGSVAIMDKRSRTAAALQSGVDLVVELPVPWATASAEQFAYGGISVLDDLGCVDTVSFGAECSDRDLLMEAAKAVQDPAVDERIRQELDGGVSYPVARALAVQSKYGDTIAEVLDQPNNILAVEYLKAMQKRGSAMKVEPIARVGGVHDSATPSGEYASASSLRIMLERGDPHAFQYMPPASADEFRRQKSIGRAPVTVDESERAILSRLRLLSKEEIAAAPDIAEGLENRIYNAIQSATSLEELYTIVKTKRYTHSRIRRIVTALYLGLSTEDRKMEVPYVRVLGFTDAGRDILKAAKDAATVPVVTKTAQISELSADAQHVFDLECKATDLYNLCTPRILPCGTEFSDEIVLL
ncbi:MAG: nucleotidyltransferase family protein [Acutalibacteraceae bacterium]|nr:nucleotidyltransferase family protein [Acutalibacteraceae bacterium]